MEWACGHAGHEQDLTEQRLPNGKSVYTATVRLIKPTETCMYFVQGMADRMAVAYHRYGPLTEAPDPRGPGGIDQWQNIDKRWARYVETRNTEWLMDIGNFAMIEYMIPSVEGAYFASTTADESPGLTVKTGVQTRETHAERRIGNVSGGLAKQMREGREGD